MNRTDRLMAMLWLLRTRKTMTAAELGATFAISERSVYRDIAALSEAGVPVVALPGPGGGYSLMKEYAITPLAFTDQEAVALLLGAKFVAGIESPFTAPATEAADRLVEPHRITFANGAWYLEGYCLDAPQPPGLVPLPPPLRPPCHRLP